MARALRIGLPLAVAVLAFLAGLAYTAAPGWIAGAVRSKLVETAQKRGLLLELGDIYVEPTQRIVLRDVVLRDAALPEPPLARVERIDVDYEIDGLFSPRLYLQNMLVVRPALQVRRDAAGQHNLQAVIAQLTKEKKEGGERSGWRKYLSRAVPATQVRGLSVAIDDESGSPLLLAGLDARHLRLHAGAADVDNRSPVQEKIKLKLQSSLRVQGLAQPLRLDAQLDWPEKQGELSVRLPGDVSLTVGDLSVQLGELTARSSGEVALGHVRIVKGGSGSRYGLDVREVAASLSREPGAPLDMPEALTAKLPPAALQALRHIRQVVVREPVIVVQRPRPAQLSSDADDDDETPAAKVEPVPEKPVAAGKKQKGKPQPAPEPKKPDQPDGEVVRAFLTGVFSKASDRLQGEVARLRTGLGSVPVPAVVIEHGSARYDDQNRGAAREVSDFSATIERKPGDGVVALQMSFNVAGRQATNHASGRFDVRTGEGEVKVQLDDLPLQPYAALLPRALLAGPPSALRGLNLSLLVNAPAGKMTLEGKGTLADVDIESPRLSKQRVQHVTATASGKLDVDLTSQRIELQQGHLEIGKVGVELAGSIDRFRTAPLFKVHVAVPTVACQDVVQSVPAGFADTLAGMRCEGRLSYELRGSLDTADMNSLEFDFRPLLGEVKIVTLGDKVDFGKFAAPFVHEAVRYRRHPQPGEPKFDVIRFETGPGSSNWVPLELVTPNFIKVITTTEDGGFFGHRGFLVDAIKSAAIANLKKGRFVRGASTITQQLVKNLFFMEREKTISRKVQEAVITWQIERTLTKQQMMELYLNIIELGPGEIYGIGAASWHYFNRAPADLTLLQALWLGSIIPSPPGYYGEFMAGKASDNHRAMLCWVADVMLKREKITAEERARLGDCSVVFGGAPDGSEEPTDPGLGHEGDPTLGTDMPPIDPHQRAPSVDPSQQP
ncbi:MAG: transglycosylase domain-containing protein [Deltaproteobacteria bacterium]|nr:transglycosylase domain-containing protein [Deltaproteobacteria bacterium]